ncbi:MAG: PKD domain-containing protein, partial [Cyclobacteriaceae bacterium]|nr:PKD domain-containing protein [Cyclobacteriaceae bacterium]MDX5466566.1 PKD domain-containing protein [Cyclobacteriaceae bacterium]
MDQLSLNQKSSTIFQTDRTKKSSGFKNSVSLQLLITLFLFGFLGMSSNVFGQFGGPISAPFPSCPQNNADVTNLQFKRLNSQGQYVDFLPTDDFPLGTPIQGAIFATFGGSTNNTNTMYAQYEVFSNGISKGIRIECLFQGIRTPQGTPQNIGSFTWNWGEKLEIRDVFFRWQTGSPKPNSVCDATGGNAQCYYNGSGFVVNTPLVANFSFATNCENRIVAFTNLTTGGDPAVDATYLWNFGNGNTSTAIDPSQTYATSGTYTVTLTSTKSGVVKTISKQVTVYDPSVLNINAPPAVCAPNTVNLTAASV